MPDERAIERLYAVFAKNVLPPAMQFCSYCDTAEHEKSLHADLRQLPEELVAKYVWDAMHHTGNDEDFKHFVPLIYQLLAEGGLPFADPEMAIGRLAKAGWSEWGVDERHSVGAVLDGLWDDVMRSEEPPVDIESLVCGLALAFQGVPPQMQTWLSDNRSFALRRLIEFVLTNAEELPNGRLRDPWWTDDTAAMGKVVQWTTSPELLDFLRRASETHLVDRSLVARALNVLTCTQA